MRAPSNPGFRARLVSSLVLIPVAVIAVVLGRPWFDLLVMLAGALMAWEWARLCGGGRVTGAGAVAIAAAVAAVAVASALSPWQALGVAGVGAIAAAAVAALHRSRPFWLAFGTLYVALPCVTVIGLRAEPAAGLETLLWLFALVWAVDTGAYLVGRSVGGPKLAPAISPKKTWSGLAGGVAAAALVGAVAGWLAEGISPLLLAALSMALAVVEQIGDLGESALKRRFGAKDSSGLIPGHGGVLDRVDGMVTVVLAVGLASALSGKSVMAW